jgi:hypothetical protein
MINTEYITAFGYDEVVLGIQSVPMEGATKAFDNFIQNFFQKDSWITFKDVFQSS